jgi:mycothiol synthase
MEFQLPDGYRLRAYRGLDDLPVMLPMLWEQRARMRDDEFPTLEQMTQTYTHLVNCDPDTDIAIIEPDHIEPDDIETGDASPVGYLRASWEPTDTGARALYGFVVVTDAHTRHDLITASMVGLEAHMRPWSVTDHDIFRAGAAHPGPGLTPGAEGYLEALVFEQLGYTARHFGASLLRPHLDDIPQRMLPNGVEVRPVTDEQLRVIFDAHWEAFRGDWNFREPTEDDWLSFRDDPLRDTSLWKIAWAGDTVVGQVKSFVNAEENERLGRRRGYTEHISVHADWRNQGIAGTLLAMSLDLLRDRGYAEAALGVDTDNPGGAFHLYTSLGFELQQFSATYEKPV